MPAPAAVADGFYHGLDGRVFLDTTELPITKWNGKDATPFRDRTHAKSGGFQAGTRGITAMNGSFSCVCPADATGDPTFDSGKTYPLVLITHDHKGYSFPAYIESIDASSETSGDLGYDVSYRSNGPIVPWKVDLPSGVLTTIGLS